MNDRQPVSGGLHIPTNVGVGDTVEKQVHSHWSTLQEQEEKLAYQGFTPMQQPTYACPHIDAELLTTADNQHYATIFAQQLSWFNYSTQLLSAAVAELLQISNEMDVIEARMRKDFRQRMEAGGKAAKMTADQMKDEILLDPRYSYLKHRHQEMTQYKVMLSAYTESIERGLKVISRQIELKKIELEQNRVNIPNRGYGYESPRRP